MSQPKGHPASEWEKLFRQAGLLVEELDRCKSARSKAVKIGQFFTPLVGRSARIRVGGREGTAVLRVKRGRSNEKRYYFHVVWDNGGEFTQSSETTERLEQEPNEDQAFPNARGPPVVDAIRRETTKLASGEQ